MKLNRLSLLGATSNANPLLVLTVMVPIPFCFYRFLYFYFLKFLFVITTLIIIHFFVYLSMCCTSLISNNISLLMFHASGFL